MKLTGIRRIMLATSVQIQSPNSLKSVCIIAREHLFVCSISTKIYPKLQSDMQRLEQDALDIRCLQLLRAIIHNEERKLPDDWEVDRQANTK